MPNAVIDNDVLLKSVSYGIFDELIGALPEPSCDYAILGAAKYALPKQLRKRPPSRHTEAQAELERILAALIILEPSREEVELAAQLEYEAQKQQLPFHSGESQLCAIMLARGFSHLLTGDKEAIVALSSMVLPEGLTRDDFAQKFVCLELAVLALLNAMGTALRSIICAEREVDTSLRICFSCSSPEVGIESWRAGLQSAIEDVRGRAPNLLLDIPQRQTSGVQFGACNE